MGTALAGVASVVVLGVLGWPGARIDCELHTCFCEAPRAGLVFQPANTWSNLAPVFAGLGVAGLAWRHPREGAAQRFLAWVGPPALVFQGVGSMYFHAGLTDWGGALDAMSMFAIAGLLVVLQLQRLSALTAARLWPAWVGLVVAGVSLGALAPSLVSMAVFALFLSILGTEVLLSRRGRTVDERLLRAGLGVHLLAVAVWFNSQVPGQLLCAPRSLWQGHALWHVLAAGSVTLMLLHVRRNLR